LKLVSGHDDPILIDVAKFVAAHSERVGIRSIASITALCDPTSVQRSLFSVGILVFQPAIFGLETGFFSGMNSLELIDVLCNISIRIAFAFLISLTPNPANTVIATNDRTTTGA
jgi:hypothetical protein